MYTASTRSGPWRARSRARGAGSSRALAEEEKTWVFYSNLRRMSKIPVVKRAFEVLAHMEKEHIDILRALLGAAPGGPRGEPGALTAARRSLPFQ